MTTKKTATIKKTKSKTAAKPPTIKVVEGTGDGSDVATSRRRR